jgi:hypothetical protein
LWDQAVELLGEGADSRLRADVLVRLSEAQWRAGERARSRATRRYAAELAESVGELELRVRAVAGVEHGQEVGDDDPVLRRLAQRTLAELGEERVRERALVMAGLADREYWGGMPS